MSNDERLKILLWRTWQPLYSHPAIFSTLASHSIGGTCAQLLWHARNLTLMGHKVQVLGATKQDLEEEGIEFLGSIDKASQEKLLRSGRVSTPDVIFLEGAFEASGFFRSLFNKAKIVHVGQNNDRYGWPGALKAQKHIDIYASVSQGHFAEHCVRYPALRYKFFLLRNIVPWEWHYCGLAPRPVEDRVAWVGAWAKKGLREWAQTLELVLKEFPSLRWDLYGPNHGDHVGGMPPHIFKGLKLPMERVRVSSLPLLKLAGELGSAKVVLVSLGLETACISALDAHAMGRPVLSGNDMVFKYNNPEGTGIRVFNSKERYSALTRLLKDPVLCDHLGRAGKESVLNDHIEEDQRSDLKKILDYLKVSDKVRDLSQNPPPGNRYEDLTVVFGKLKRIFR